MKSFYYTIAGSVALFAVFVTSLSAQTNYPFDKPTGLDENPALPNANAGVVVHVDTDPAASIFSSYTGTWTPVTTTGSGSPYNVTMQGFDITGFDFKTGQITAGILVDDAADSGMKDNKTTVSGNVVLNGASVSPLSAFAYIGNKTGFFAEIDAASSAVSVTNSAGGGANGLLFLADTTAAPNGSDLVGKNIKVGNITAASTNDAATTTSTGFFAGTLRKDSDTDSATGSNVTLGDITVSSTGAAASASAVTVGGIDGKGTGANSASSLIVGKINVNLTTTETAAGTAARGIYVKNQSSAATGGNVNGTLNVNGAVNVTANGTAAYARGIEIDGKAENLIIKYNVTATSNDSATDGTLAVSAGSGKITINTATNKDLQISASNTAGTRSSIAFTGSQTTDTLEISGSNIFTNNAKTFIVNNADTVNIKTDTELVADSQFTGVTNTLSVDAYTKLQFGVKNGVKNLDVNKVELANGAVIRFSGAVGTYNNVMTVANDAAGIAAKLAYTEGLMRQTATANGNNISITISQQKIADFLSGYDVTQNTIKTGNLYDSYIAKNAAMNTKLTQMEDEELLELAMKTTGGVENVVNIRRLALWNPHFYVFNRLYGEVDNDPFYRGVQYRGQCAGCAGIVSNGGCKTPVPYIPDPNCNVNRGGGYKTGLWGLTYFRSEDWQSDRFASGADNERWGVMVGKETRLDYSVLAGVMFGYGNPQVRNGISKSEADDYTVAGYVNGSLGGNTHTNFFLGYGHQEYTHDSEKTTSSDGDALYTSVEVYHSLRCYRTPKNSLRLFPLAAFDYQQSWADAAGIFGGSESAMRVSKQQLYQGVIRTGINMKFDTSEGMAVRSRVQYGYLVTGNPYGAARASFVADSGSSQVFRSVNASRSNVNLGLGLDFATGTNYKLFLDYDCNYGDRMTAHSGQLGLATAW
ncbi:hypothetical protein FACS1894170_07240 [Planctomycetales bacterium]|nr:hypothetical protein FACS1894170_07240 [Planctomycetales bacterium]